MQPRQPAQHIGQRILAIYNDMPRGERRLADLLLEDLVAVRHQTAGDLAQRAWVSKATAARLFQRLGYSGFKALQREVRTSDPMSQTTDPESAVGAGSLSPGAHLDAEVQQLVRTFELLRSDELGRAVRLLHEGEKLWVVGFGEDYPLAHFARSLLIRLRSDIRMIPIGGFPIPEELASITKQDTVLALGIGRRTPEFLNVVTSAARIGASIVLVTDLIYPQDRKLAKVILRGRATQNASAASVTAPVSLMSYLCMRLAQLIGDPAAIRMREIESIHTEWTENNQSS